jgi:hypothetical protein
MRHILHKSAPLFSLSIAISLLAAATAAEAASAVSPIPAAGKLPISPDDVVRKMALNEVGTASTAPVVSLFKPNGDVVMPASTQTQAQSQGQAVQSCVTSTCKVQPQQLPSGSTFQAPAQTPSTVQNVLDTVVSGIRSSNTAPIAAVPNTIAQPATPLTTPLPTPSTAQPTPLASDQPAAIAAVAAPTAFIESRAPRSQTLASSLDVGSFGRRLVAKSQSLMLSIRSDSSGLFSFGSTRLEIPAKLSSRLTLSTNASLPEKLVLTDISWQPRAEGQPSAMRLLMTDQASNVRSTVVLSLISAHRLANKPNV